MEVLATEQITERMVIVTGLEKCRWCGVDLPRRYRFDAPPDRDVFHPMDLAKCKAWVAVASEGRHCLRRQCVEAEREFMASV